MYVIDSIRDCSVNFYNSIPKGTGANMFRCALISSGITVIFTQNINLSVFAGAAAAVTTLIHGITVPLFKKLNDGPHISLWKAVVVVGINSVISQAIINKVSPNIKVAFVGFMVAISAIKLFFDYLGGATHVDLDQPGSYYFLCT